MLRFADSPLKLELPLFSAQVPAGFPSPADDHIEGKLDLKSKEGADTAPPGYKPWFAHKGRRSRHVKIIFGHWAALEGRCTEPGVYALDTGCVWGGAMTLFNVDTGQYHRCECTEEGTVRPLASPVQPARIADQS